MQLAKALRARLILMHAYRPPILSLRAGVAATASDVILQAETEARARLDEAVSEALSELPSVDARLVQGDPRDAILDLARVSGADLIVVGARGRGAAAKLLLGSVTAHIVRHAPCAVLTIPPAP
ncbi:MAG: universal stress protein [Polyangiales bacterium]